MLLLTFTNESHRLVYAQNHLDTSGGWPLLVSSWGPAGWANIAYSYALVAVGLAMILLLILRSHHGHARRAVILLLIGLIPLIADLFYVFGRTPLKDLDLTPLSFIVVALVLASGITGLSLSDVLSVSRREVLENMRDGLVVLDPALRVIDLNSAARQLARTHSRILSASRRPRCGPSGLTLGAPRVRIRSIRRKKWWYRRIQRAPSTCGCRPWSTGAGLS